MKRFSQFNNAVFLIFTHFKLILIQIKVQEYLKNFIVFIIRF